MFFANIRAGKEIYKGKTEVDYKSLNVEWDSMNPTARENFKKLDWYQEMYKLIGNA